MVLIFCDRRQVNSPLDSNCFYLENPEYIAIAQQLLALPVFSVAPTAVIYVGQREFATTAPYDTGFNTIGADDVGTCIIAIIKHTASGAIGLACFDGSGVANAVDRIIMRMDEMSVGYPDGRYELQLIGGYVDPAGISEQILRGIFHAFHEHDQLLHVTLVCVGQLNNNLLNGQSTPIICGVAVNIQTGCIYPANFTDHGPDVMLRAGRIVLSILKVCHIYDTRIGLLCFEVYKYRALSDAWLEKTDEEILDEFTPCPQADQQYFIAQIRATIQFLYDNPNPLITIFKRNRCRYHKHNKDTGTWHLVEP